MARYALSALCLAAVAWTAGANPGEQFATGRERPAEDHEFYRSVEVAAPAATAPTGAGRYAPPVDVQRWVKTARGWAAKLGLPVYAR